MFFKIIGMLVVGFFVFVFLLAFVGQFWVKHKFKKILQQAQNSRNPNHSTDGQTIDVEPDVFLSLIKRSYADLSESVGNLREVISSQGFTEFNVYEIPEMPFSAILASRREDGLFAVIYDAENSVHYDLLAKSNSGNIFTISNSGRDYRALSGQHVYKKMLPRDASFIEATDFLREEKLEDLQVLQQSDFESVFLQSFQS